MNKNIIIAIIIAVALIAAAQIFRGDPTTKYYTDNQCMKPTS